MAETELDLQGLKCPLPVLRANKAMKKLDDDDVLRVLVTDPAAPKDFKVYCKTTGHEHIGCTESDGVFTIELKKR